MSISNEIQALYNLTKDKLGELPAEVHSFFAAKVESAKVDEAAAAAEAAKIQAEIEHLTASGYSVVKVGFTAAENAPAPVFDNTVQATNAASIIGAPIAVNAPVVGAPIA